jgi:hypothetical protein
VKLGSSPYLALWLDFGYSFVRTRTRSAFRHIALTLVLFPTNLILLDMWDGDRCCIGACGIFPSVRETITNCELPAITEFLLLCERLSEKCKDVS